MTPTTSFDIEPNMVRHNAYNQHHISSRTSSVKSCGFSIVILLAVLGCRTNVAQQPPSPPIPNVPQYGILGLVGESEDSITRYVRESFNAVPRKYPLESLVRVDVDSIDPFGVSQFGKAIFVLSGQRDSLLIWETKPTSDTDVASSAFKQIVDTLKKQYGVPFRHVWFMGGMNDQWKAGPTQIRATYRPDDGVLSIVSQFPDPIYSFQLRYALEDTVEE